MTEITNFCFSLTNKLKEITIKAETGRRKEPAGGFKKEASRGSMSPSQG